MATGSIFNTPEKRIDPVPANRILFDAAVGPATSVKVKARNNVLFASATVRKRIDANSTDLAKFSSNSVSINRALALIRETNVDKLKLEFVMAIGQQEQEQHKLIAQKCLSYTSSDLIQVCQNDLAELMNLVSNCEHPSSQNALMSKIEFFKEKAQAKFQEATQKIYQVSNSLQARVGEIQKLLRECEDLVLQINQLKESLDPIIISCQFFSEYVKDNFPNSLYISRYSGLLSTSLNLQQNIIQVEAFKKSLIELIDTILHVVLTDIPSWLSNCTNSQLQQTILKKLNSYA